MITSSRSLANSGFGNQQKPYQSFRGLFLDGISDQVDGARSKSPVNLYKALPPVPPLNNSVSRTPQSASTNATLFTNSQDTTYRPSTVSSLSSGRSRSSSKTDFRIITRGLFKRETAGLNIVLSPVEPDMYLHPAKYNPGEHLKSPKTPASFTSIMNSNPYVNEPSSPIYMPPPLSLRGNQDPTKADHGRTMPQSRSEPTLHGLDGEQDTKPARYQMPIHVSQRPPTVVPADSPREAVTGPRGRPVNRPSSPVKKMQDLKEGEVLDVQNVLRKRSRSPVKRLLGLGKSTSLKDIAGEPHVHAGEEQADKGKRTGLKVWGDKFKHGFLTSESKPPLTASPRDVKTTPPSRQCTFAVSLDPPYQAKVYSEIELMVCVTANRYLMRELAAGRLSTESITKVSSYWTGKNRPQVIEFQYDQATQRDLILYNITTLKFHGESAESPLVLNATMYSWKTMAKEMSVRTFCAPDSQVRKHMHDAHKILEMLGAPLVTFLAFQELQLKTLAKFNDAAKQIEEKRRDERRKECERECGPNLRKNLKEGGQPCASRNTSAENGEKTQHLRKKSRDEKEKDDVENVTENSRGGRLGLMIKAERYA